MDENTNFESYLNEKYGSEIKVAGIKNGKIKQVQSLIRNTKSNPRNLFVAEGIWAYEMAVDNSVTIDSLFFCCEYLHSREAIDIVEKAIESGTDCYSVSSKVFLKISEREKPDGILIIGEMPVWRLDDIHAPEKGIVIVLDGVEIPGNIGTIIRSADGAGANGIIICNRRARLTHPKILKGSQGACFKIPIVECEVAEAVNWFEKNGFKVYLTDTSARSSYFEYDYKGKVAFVAGSERYGITQEWYNMNHTKISIPMLGSCDSLNVAVSASIVLYEMSMKINGFKI